MAKIKMPKYDPNINTSGVVKLTPEAASALLQVAQHTNMPLKSIASTIIVEAVNNNLIEYDGENNDS